MKGKFTIKIEETDETGFFPITSSWQYSIDNTPESLETYIDIFNKILAVQGFSGKLEDYLGGEND